VGNKIIMISSYCDNPEKLDVLDLNIRTLKNLGFDVMLNSPIDLPNSVTSLCDFYIRTKENPVFDWPHKCVYTWSEYNHNGSKIRIARSLPDYGWANVYQVKKLSEYALTYDYEYFYHIIYDLKIDDIVLKALLSDEKCRFYHFHEHHVSLHMMLFNRKNILEFISKIELNEYLKFGGIAESWLKNFIEKSDLGYSVSDEYVDDHILYHSGIDLFNYSRFKNFKYFISKNSLGVKDVEIYFYDISDRIEITINIDLIPKKYIIKDRDIIKLGFTSDNIKPVIIEYMDSSMDITDDIIKIAHNNIEIYE
jgi:hypothetical protein